MSEFDDQINVTPVPGASYNVFSGYSKDVIAFSAGGLLALGDWITAHHGELTAQVNGLDMWEDSIEPLTPGDDHESIETHLQELTAEEYRQAEEE
jgi:hypothetical protein